MTESPYLTAKEAAAYLRFKSVESLYAAVETDHIPVYRRGSRTLLFHRDQLDAWLSGGGRRSKPTLAKVRPDHG